jgi:hypothetical protein
MPSGRTVGDGRGRPCCAVRTSSAIRDWMFRQKRSCVHRPNIQNPRRMTGFWIGAGREYPATRNVTRPVPRFLITS